MENGDYVVVGLDFSLSKPMKKKEAIQKVKENYFKGITSYIVTREEAEKIKEEGNVITPDLN